MAEDSFILVNLKEKESKTLAQVLSNETSRKILDYLATVEDATESAISKELGIPLSTIHYNLKHLKKAKLVETKEFHYSSKGKEVDHYRLANKLVIIAPRASKIDELKQQLGRILPAFGVSVAGAFLVYVFGRMYTTNTMGAADTFAAPMMQESMKAGVAEVEGDVMPMLATRSADMMAEQAISVVHSAPDPLTMALWFLAGALFASACVGLFAWIRSRYGDK